MRLPQQCPLTLRLSRCSSSMYVPRRCAAAHAGVPGSAAASPRPASTASTESNAYLRSLAVRLRDSKGTWGRQARRMVGQEERCTVRRNQEPEAPQMLARVGQRPPGSELQ